MTRHSSRYLNTDESASLNWLEQSNIFDTSQSGEYEGNHGEVADDESKGSQVKKILSLYSMILKTHG